MPPQPTPCYRGRFAPSPTGALHLGSLLTALGSYLDARTQHGVWLLRMEDLDPPREVAGAATAIIDTLQAYGFAWDEPIMFQSGRHAVYEAGLQQLIREGKAFACGCTRKEIASHGHMGLDGYIYPGTCRQGLPPGRTGLAWRLHVPAGVVYCEDRLQGTQQQEVARSVGDFILRRADGYFAYQLAVVIDDAAQGITDVVRGADLLDSTPRQVVLQQALRLPTPRHLHLPVLVDGQGQKLSKQTLAQAINADNALSTLKLAWQLLGQTALPARTLPDFWREALASWQGSRLPRGRTIHGHTHRSGRPE
jgi:glutamyl-Q tRNA(Asp) synthetase